MNVLVTAIGSMSAECVIASLKKAGYGVVATDIYDECFHPVARECLAFEKVIKAVPDPVAYCEVICDVAARHGCEAVIPLTDPEVDALSPNRKILEEKGVAVWLGSPESIALARDCDAWSRKLSESRTFKTIPTVRTYAELLTLHRGEFVAKRVNGRSSEGILFSNTGTFALSAPYETGYVFQPFIDGDIITVDFARHPKSQQLVVVPRQEMMRTKNGAGTVVKMLDPELVRSAVSEMCEGLGLTGVMNCEFIRNETDLYLMDINPRFSAGVSFSRMAGYDFVTADVACYMGSEVAPASRLSVGAVFVKRFSDYKSSIASC